VTASMLRAQCLTNYYLVCCEAVQSAILLQLGILLFMFWQDWSFNGTSDDMLTNVRPPTLPYEALGRPVTAYR